MKTTKQHTPGPLKYDPDLLEALVGLEEYVRTVCLCGPVAYKLLDKARAAINKTHGKE